MFLPAAALAIVLSPSVPSGQPQTDLNALDAQLAEWEGEAKSKLAKDPELKRLAARFPLVVLHARGLAGRGYYKCAYSFIHQTTNEQTHRNDVQLQFGNGKGKRLDVNMLNGQQNLIVDLSNADFTKDPDPKKVDLDADNSWVYTDCRAEEGHVYLERIRDNRGNKFYVVFKVVSVEDGKYLAFLWRMLPGGKVIVQPAGGTPNQ
jgi:hypothetical protein